MVQYNQYTRIIPCHCSNSSYNIYMCNTIGELHARPDIRHNDEESVRIEFLVLWRSLLFVIYTYSSASCGRYQHRPHYYHFIVCYTHTHVLYIIVSSSITHTLTHTALEKKNNTRYTYSCYMPTYINDDVECIIMVLYRQRVIIILCT